MGNTPRANAEPKHPGSDAADGVKDLLLQRRALVADLRAAGSDRLTRATIEAQIKMIDGRLSKAVQS